MSPYSKSQSVSPRRRARSPPMKSKAYGSSGHRYSYSRSRSVSAPHRRPPSPPPLMNSGRRNCSSSRSSSRSVSPPRRHRRNSPGQNQRRSHVVENRCIGVFGLNVNTTQAKIREIFSKYGPIERIQVVIDAQTKRSRGFCFIYYKNIEDARNAKTQCCGIEVDSRRIRVDYSITQRAHTPTPGVYMGRPLKRFPPREGRERDRERDTHERHRDTAHYSRPRQPRTPPSPPPSHSCSHRNSRRSRSHSSYYNERSRRRGYEYSSRSRSRSHTPRKRSRY